MTVSVATSTALAALLGVAPASPNDVESTRPDAATEVASPQVIVVAVLDRGADDDVEQAIEALLTHLGAKGTRVVVERPQVEGLRRQIAWAKKASVRHGAAGVFWLDIERGDDLVLYLVEPQGKSALLRTIPRDPESDVATYETLGTIAGSITTALLEGARIGMTPVEIDDPEPARVESEPPTSPAGRSVEWPRLRLAVGYVGASFADELPWTHGVGIDIVGRPHPSLFVGAGYAFMAPAEIEKTSATFQIQRNPVRLFLGFHYQLTRPERMIGRRLALEVEPRLTIDPIRDIVSSVDPGFESGADDVRVAVGAGLSMRLLWYVWRNLSLTLTAGFEAPLNPFDYVVRTGAERSESVSPHPVRGELNVGIAHGFFHRGRRPRRGAINARSTLPGRTTARH